MLGAIYVGLSGLTSYSNGLQTISNNVANMNSAGFKATNVSFSDLFDTSGGGGLTFDPGNGGKGTGYGVQIAKPTINFAQGTLAASSGDLDLAINGSGFLVLLDGDKTLYTRTGQFSVGTDGYITQQNARNRLGMLGASGTVEALNVDGKRTSAPIATTMVAFADNLSSDANSASVSNIAVYDSSGGKHVWTIAFARDPASTSTTGTNWTVTVTDSTGATIGTSTLKFIGNTVDPTTNRLVITSNPAGTAPLSVTLDFSAGVTSFAGGTTSTLRAANTDGRGLGTLSTVTVDDSGKIKLTYSNGATDAPAAIALADFRDVQDLRRAGNGLFTFNGSGERRLLASGAEGIGTIASKQIEGSNVDLSTQFGELILVQRGYQASSQVVSVANDMIQQLFGIRGQGG